MKSKSKPARKIICFFMLICLISLSAGGAYAGAFTWEAISGIDVDIKWYDFGSKYKDCQIQDAYGTGYYQISMTEGDGLSGHKEGILNGKGEVVIEPDAYEISGVQYYPDDFRIATARKGDVCYLISADGIVKIDTSTYEKVDTFFNGYANVTLKANSQCGVIDTKGNLLFTSGQYKRFQHLGDGVFAALTDTEQPLGWKRRDTF